MTTPKPSLAKAVTERIEQQQLKPRSLASIVIEQLGYASLVLVCFFLVVAGINLISFWLRASGFGDFLGAGTLGLQAFATGFPYGLLILTVLAFAILLAVFRHYDLSYKQPFVIVAGVFLLLTTGLGLLVARSELNEHLSRRVEQGEFRPLRAVYSDRLDFRHHSRHAVVGPLTAKQGTQLTIQTRRNIVILETDDKTTYPLGQPSINDRVRALIEQSQAGGHPVARIIFVTPTIVAP